MFGARRYPVTFAWQDGSRTHFESEQDHLYKVNTCRHEASEFSAQGETVQGCWKCLSIPLYLAPGVRA